MFLGYIIDTIDTMHQRKLLYRMDELFQWSNKTVKDEMQ